MIPDSLPHSSPHPPPPPRVDGAFAAVLIPLGLMAGVIVAFALWTTDQLVVPELTHKTETETVLLFGQPIGSIAWAHPVVWGISLLALFVTIGGFVGLGIGKGLDRLSRWGT